MALLTQKGTYLARPTSWGIKAEEGKCPKFAVVFQCDQVRKGSDWTPVEGDQKITGFFTLINKDGSPNEINLRALKDSLAWDGSSLASLDEGQWGDTEVQIVVEGHEYNGKHTLEVRYLNPKDYAGSAGVQKADPQAVQSLDQKYGATIRALFGTKKGVSPAKPAAPTAAPDTPDGAKQLAWKAFIEKTPDFTPGERTEAFRAVVKDCHPTKEAKALTVENWNGLATAITKDYDPTSKALLPF